MFVRVCVRLSYDTHTETPTHDSFLSFYGSNGEIEKSLINLQEIICVPFNTH